MTQALATRFPGIRVTAVTPGPVISRVSTNARFRIECEGALPEGLSADLCAKGYFGAEGSLARMAGVPEEYFYRDLAAATGVRTLHSVYADVDPETYNGVVITEDVIAQGATFLDSLSDYTPDQVAASLEQLAILHAGTWMSAALVDAAWLASRLGRTAEHRGVKEISGNFETAIGAGVPQAVRDPRRLYDAYCALGAETLDVSPWSVIHGDAHVGNLYLDGAGQPCFVDWQLVQRGPWYIDVGYHIASALPVEVRREAEHDLVDHYLECLAARAIDAPDRDTAWQGVRRGMLHGFFLWGITLRVDPPITTAMLERMGTAAADHDVLAAMLT